MRTKVFFQTAVLCLLFTGFFYSCRKNASQLNKNVLTASMQRSFNAKTDGIITVQPGILPPVTIQTFIPGGGSSVTQFEIVSSKHILLDQLTFSAGPLVKFINVNGSGQPNNLNAINFNAVGVVNKDSGFIVSVSISYNNVDSTTSGQNEVLNLTHISYRTDDDVYHDFSPGVSGKSQQMCIINNMAQLQFKDPKKKKNTLPNGYKEIAAIDIMGDTNWTLNALPVVISSPFGAIIPRSKLIVKAAGQLSTQSDSIELNGGTTQTVIHFTNGFQHVAGATETLKIYANVTTTHEFIATALGILNSFEWVDGTGVTLTGSRNSKFFKEETGQSNYH